MVARGRLSGNQRGRTRVNPDRMSGQVWHRGRRRKRGG